MTADDKIFRVGLNRGGGMNARERGGVGVGGRGWGGEGGGENREIKKGNEKSKGLGLMKIKVDGPQVESR